MELFLEAPGGPTLETLKNTLAIVPCNYGSVTEARNPKPEPQILNPRPYALNPDLNPNPQSPLNPLNPNPQSALNPLNPKP